LGLFSFIGLSWILVPFQAYASIKALFEKKEGGWVRTPKSGRVTESLERFHLARLMPWELPKRKRGQSKSSSGVGRLAAGGVVVIGAAGIITVGALSIRAAATSGAATENDLIVPAVIGTTVPLLVLALGWLRLRRRMTAIVLAFTLGLGTNVVYLAQAVPANAVTDNTSTFTFRNTTGFNTPNKDMVQNYTPAGGGTTCPSTSGHYWTCAFASDTFTTGQALSAGTAQTTLYLRNSTPLPTLRTSYGTSCAPGCSGIGVYRPPGTVDNDVMIAIVSVSPKKGITAPAGWTLIASLSNGTAVTTAAYWKVAASGDPASWSWTWGGNTSTEGIILSYTSVDTASPIDAFASGTDASGTSHTAPSVTTTSANDLVITAYGLDALATWTPP